MAIGQLTELRPDHRRLVADANMRLGREDLARKLFTGLLEQARQDADARTLHGLSLIGWCLYRLGEYDDAAEVFTETLAIETLSVSNQFDLGLVTLCAREHRAAVSEYERGIEIAENNAGLRGRMALRVALIDLRDAAERSSEVQNADVARRIELDLEAAYARADRRYAQARAERQPDADRTHLASA